MFGLPSARASFTGLEPAKTHDRSQSQRSGTLMLGEFKRLYGNSVRICTVFID